LKFCQIFIIETLSLALVSCAVFPYKYKYYYINYPDDKNAVHERRSQYTSAPDLIRFQYEKIFFTVLIQEDEILFGLEIPENNTVQLLEKKLKLDLGNGNVHDLDFSQSDRSYAGPALPPNWAFDNEYPINKDGFGQLNGGTVIKNWPLNKNVHFYVNYYYQAKFTLGRGLRGTLVLPKLIINSMPCAGPSVQFEWREKLGVGSIGP
jgi:hypothetical protein